MSAALEAFGRRNIAYLVFTALAVLLAIWLESTSGAQGPDRGGGHMIGLVLWFIASLASVGVNGVLFFVGLAKKRPVTKEIIGLALPFIVVAVVLGLEPLLT
ncbi:MAG: hypothetical protein FJX20_17785 [Alphaproteobacteria bacterium]|nr:hypothetical protein [Alphaproteobacteria bacterium]